MIPDGDNNQLLPGKARNLMTDATRHAVLLAEWQEKARCEGYAEIRTDVIFAVAEYDKCADEFYIEAMGKTSSQIYRANFRTEYLNYEDIMRVFASTNAAPRPIRLGTAFNGFWATCALAFFITYCRRFYLDAGDLYAQAYQGDLDPLTEAEQEIILSNADWEGIEFPEFWDLPTLLLLGDALTNINYHQLRNELANLEEIGVFEQPSKPRQLQIAISFPPAQN